MELNARSPSQEFPTSTKNLQKLLKAYRDFARTQLKKSEISNKKLDSHILKLEKCKNFKRSETFKKEKKKPKGKLYEAFCIYGVRKKKLIEKFEQKSLNEKIVNKILSKEKIRISSNVSLTYCDLNKPASETSRKVVIDSRDIVYQNNVILSPLWTRENLNK